MILKMPSSPGHSIILILFIVLFLAALQSFTKLNCLKHIFPFLLFLPPVHIYLDLQCWCGIFYHTVKHTPPEV